MAENTAGTLQTQVCGNARVVCSAMHPMGRFREVTTPPVTSRHGDGSRLLHVLAHLKQAVTRRHELTLKSGVNHMHAASVLVQGATL